MSDRIPLIKPTLPSLDGEMRAELELIWASRQLTTGGNVARFEEAVTGLTGAPHVVALSSCTSGLMLALQAMGLEGEVVLPSFTWTATAQAVVWNRLRPVFVDSDPGTFTIDPRRVEDAITDRTCAIMPVTIFGCPPDVDALVKIAQSRGLRLLFDSAQGLGSSWRGARLACFGDAEVFSLSPTKVVTAMEGGLVTTCDGDLAARIRRGRDYGKTADAADFDVLGLSARMPEACGLVGRLNLRRLDDFVACRNELVDRYHSGLRDLPGVSFQEIPPDRVTNWNYFVVRVGPGAQRARDDLWSRLKERGIETKRYFHPAVHRQAIFRDLDPADGSLPVATALANECLALPLYSEMSHQEVDRVVEAVHMEIGR